MTHWVTGIQTKTMMKKPSGDIIKSLIQTLIRFMLSYHKGRTLFSFLTTGKKLVQQYYIHIWEQASLKIDMRAMPAPFAATKQ